MNEFSPITPGEILSLPTPALLLDKSKLQANADRMRDRVDSLGVTLRPHVKTSKSIDVLRVLAGGRNVPITVSTLAEAAYFFERGVSDILYAVGIAPVKLPLVADLIRSGCTLRVILDSLEAAESLASFAASEGVAIEALIEVDTDGCRAGVAPDSELLIEIAQRLEDRASLAGVMTHAGGSYSARTLGEFEAIAERERAGAVTAAERLRAARADAPVAAVQRAQLRLCGRPRSVAADPRCPAERSIRRGDPALPRARSGEAVPLAR